MKNLIICLTLLFPLSAMAQNDSLKVSYSEEKVESFEKTTLIDEYEKAFGGNRVVTHALRVNFAKIPYTPNLNTFQYKFKDIFDNVVPQIQFEQKIGVDKSLIASFDWNRNVFIANYNIGLEGRWYYRMKDRVNAGIQKPNITGKYLSLKVEYNPYQYRSRYGNMIPGYAGGNYKPIATHSLNWGTQFGNSLNFGLSAGIQYGNEGTINSEGIWLDIKSGVKKVNWFITTNTQLGLGLYLPRKRKITNESCEFLRCNYEVKQLFKLNLNEVFYLDKYTQTAKLDLAYERKIGYSPFSVNSNVVGGFFNSYSFVETGERNPNPPFDFLYSPVKRYFFGYTYSISEQIRYYLNMQKKIVKGTSAGNLNGIYVGLVGNYRVNAYHSTTESEFSAPNSKQTNLNGGLLVGYQVQTNRKSFLDINASYVYQNTKTQSEYNKVPHLSEYKGLKYFEISLKLGIAK